MHAYTQWFNDEDAFVSYFFAGIGEPAYFYVESVFLLNGIMMGIFFLFGTFLR